MIPPATLDKAPCNAKPNATPHEVIKAVIDAVSIPTYPTKHKTIKPFTIILIADIVVRKIVSSTFLALSLLYNL